MLVCLAAVALCGCSPSDPLQAVRDQQAKGDFAGSLEPLRALLAKDRNDPEVNYLYGRGLAMTGQTSLAEWSLRKAMDDPEWRQAAGRQLAYGELSTGNYPAAIASLTELLESNPDDLDLLLMRANAYAHSRLHPEEALADAARIQELDPTNADVMEPKILALLALERYEEAGQAIDELGKLIEENQLDPSVQAWHCSTRAIFADESDEEETARTRWEDCLERFPDHPNVVGSAIEFYDKHGEYARSLDILRAAVDTAPASRDYRVRLAQRLRAMGNVTEAEKILLEPTGSSEPAVAAAAWFDLAKHYQELGKEEEAADALGRCIEKAKAAGSVQPQMLLEYADALLLAGRFDESLAVADDMTVDAHKEVIRARVAQERGHPAEALEHFDEALRLWPDNPWARYYAARAAEAIGDFDRAIDAYRYSIRINAGATDARVRLARLQVAQGRPADAVVMLRIQSQNAPLNLEGELLSMRLWGRLEQGDAARNELQRFHAGAPVFYGAALASFAKGVRERLGPAAAVRVLREQPGLDLANPEQADALRELLVLSREARERGAPGGEALDAAARADLAAGLKAHPDASAFHEIQGFVLEQDGRSDEARSAYESALQLDAQNERAVAGLGRLVAPRGSQDRSCPLRARDRDRPERRRRPPRSRPSPGGSRAVVGSRRPAPGVARRPSRRGGGRRPARPAAARFGVRVGRRSGAAAGRAGGALRGRRAGPRAAGSAAG